MLFENIADNAYAHNWVVGYIGVCLASALAFICLRYVWHQVPLYFFVMHATIVTWSATMYCNFLFPTPVSSYAWYCDWLLSTPLIVLALGLTAHAASNTINWSYMWALMAAQLLTITPGFLGHMTDDMTARYIWFTIGCCAMICVMYLLWFPVRTIAIRSNAEVAHKYTAITAFLILLWIAYPTFWIMSPLGYAYFAWPTTKAIFVILPALCKPIFGFVDLYCLYTIRKHLSQ